MQPEPAPPEGAPRPSVKALQRKQSEGASDSEGGRAAPAEVPSVPPGKESGPPAWWQRFRYNPWVFYPIVVLSTLIALVGLIFGLIQAGADFGAFSRQVKEWGLVREFPSEHKGEMLIVIAQFYHSEGVVDTEAHNEIRDAIQTAAQELGESSLRVAVSSMLIAADDQGRARKLGQMYDASIVIWGADTGVRVTVNFLNLKHPDFDAAAAQINETLRTQLVNPSAYASFVTRELPGQLSFLSLFAIGQSYYIQAAYGEAVKVIEKGIAALAPESEPPAGLAEAYFGLGWLFETLREDQRAIASYTKAIALKPDRAEAYVNRGRARHYRGDLAGALQDYDNAIELEPQFADAYLNRGSAHYDQGRLDAAIQDYGKAIELEPQFADAYYSRGIARKAQGDLDAAIQDYGKVIEIEPQFANAYLNRGGAHYDLGRLDAAIQDYDKAIELNPQSAAAYSNRGNVHHDQGRLDAAIQDYDKAIELDPQQVVTYSNRGSIRKAQGDRVGAIADFRRYLELSPKASDRREVEQWIVELEQQFSKP